MIEKRYLGAIHLILYMVAFDPDQRPTARSVKNHHIFWDEQRVINFLLNVSNCAERPSKGSHVDSCVQELDNGKWFQHLFPNTNRDESCDWSRLLCKTVKRHLNWKHPNRVVSYKTDSVMQLLRFIRNLYTHYNTLPYVVRQALGPMPNDFLIYWLNRFPFLIEVLFIVFEKMYGTPGNPLEHYYPVEYKHHPSDDNQIQSLLQFVKTFVKDKIRASNDTMTSKREAFWQQNKNKDKLVHHTKQPMPTNVTKMLLNMPFQLRLIREKIVTMPDIKIAHSTSSSQFPNTYFSNQVTKEHIVYAGC